MKSEMNSLLRKRSPRRSPCGVRRASPLLFGNALIGGYRVMTSFPTVLAVLFRSPLALRPRCDGFRKVSARSLFRRLQPSGSLSWSWNPLSAPSRRKAAMPAALHMRLSKSATGWEKFDRKPPIMAITLFLDRDRAKKQPTTSWEKVQRKPPIMAASRKHGERIGETAEFGEAGEDNPAFDAAGGRPLKGSASRLTSWATFSRERRRS